MVGFTFEDGPQRVGEARRGSVSPRLIIWVGVVATALLLAGLLGYNCPAGKRLSRYKAQLRSQGEKLTFAELVLPASSNDLEVATRLISVGNGFNSIGLSPGSLELMSYVQPARARVAWKQDTPTWMNRTAPGASAGWERFGECMEQASDSLAELRETLREPPALSWQPVTNFTGPIPNFVHTRLAAQWLSGDAIYQLRMGKLEKALQDLEALASCAQVSRDDLTLVAQMIRVAVTGLGLSTTWEALQAPGWTEPQLARLQKAWEPVDLVEALEKGFLSIRAEGVEVWSMVRHGARARQIRGIFVMNAATNLTFETFLTDHVFFTLYKITSMDEDELFYLESVQGSIVAIRRIKQGQPWDEKMDGLSQASVRLTKLASGKQRYRHWLSLFAVPNFIRAIRVGTQNETLRQLTLTAIAIKRFQLRHGTLPLNLKMLRPEFLSEPTYDPFSGKSLQYVIRAEGRSQSYSGGQDGLTGSAAFLLYSVGPNGLDDGGETPFWYRGKPGLWDELDAVWPEPEGQARQLSLLRP